MTAEAVPLAPAPEGWTIADVDALPENGLRYELVDGVPRVVTPPKIKHQRACKRVDAALEASDDRFRKPAQYAQAGIPTYLRIGLDPPHIVAYGIGEDGLHVEIGRAEPGRLLHLTEPFPVTLDPAALLR
jgi:hypothetical protein